MAAGVAGTAVFFTRMSHSGMYCAWDLLRYLIRGLGSLLLVPALGLPAPAAPPSGPSTGAGGPAERPSPPSCVTLHSPRDLGALLQKSRHPGLELRRVDRPVAEADGKGPAGGRTPPPPGIVESVRVRGRVAEAFASLQVELGIVTTAA